MLPDEMLRNPSDARVVFKSGKFVEWAVGELLLDVKAGKEALPQMLDSTMRQCLSHIKGILVVVKKELIPSLFAQKEPERVIWEAYWQTKLHPECPRHFSVTTLVRLLIDHRDEAHRVYFAEDKAREVLALISKEAKEK